jgi:hypothetical protein
MSFLTCTELVGFFFYFSTLNRMSKRATEGLKWTRKRAKPTGNRGSNTVACLRRFIVRTFCANTIRGQNASVINEHSR